MNEHRSHHPLDWHFIWLVPVVSAALALLCVVIAGYWPTLVVWLTMGGVAAILLVATWMVDALPDTTRPVRVGIFFFLGLAGIGLHLVLIASWGRSELLTPPIWAWQTTTIEETFVVAAPNQRLHEVQKKQSFTKKTRLGEVAFGTYRGIEFGMFTWEFRADPPPGEEEILTWVSEGRPVLIDGKPATAIGAAQDYSTPKRKFREDDMLIADFVGEFLDQHTRVAIRGRFACQVSKTGDPRLDYSDRYFLDSVRILKARN